jgi:hypothetical protein
LAGTEDFSFLLYIITPSRIFFIGYRDSFPWMKRPRREVDHSPPSNAEVIIE